MHKIHIWKKIAKLGAIAMPFSALAVLACNDEVTKLYDQVDATDFEVSGSNGLAFIRLKSIGAISQALEVRYYKGLTTPLDDSFYNSSLTNLSNGDTVWIKLFVRSSVANRFEIESKTTSLVVEGLEKIRLSEDILSTSFETYGHDGAAEIQLKDSVKLDNALEVRYFKGETEPEDLTSYRINLSDLANNDKVWARLFVKSTHENTYEVDLKVTSLVVSNLKTFLNVSLQPDDFELNGTQNFASVSLKSTKELPTQVEVRYFKGNARPINDVDYTRSISNLANGDKVWVRLFVKSLHQANYVTSDIAFSLTINNLNRILLNDSLAESDFDFNLVNNRGVISLKSAKTLAPELEVRYAKAETAPENLNDYQANLSNLVNGDKVWARLFVKPFYETTHEIWRAPIAVVASGVITFLTDTLSASDFNVTGSGALNGTLSLNKIIAPQLELRYAVATTRPSETSFSLSVPTNLANGDKVWIQMQIKSSASDLYDSNPILITKDISGLAKVNLTETLTSAEVNFVGPSSQGEISLTKILDPKLEVRYFVGMTAPTDEAAYVTNLSLLTNDDKVWTKLFVKPDFANNYQINFSPFVKTVTLVNFVLNDTLEMLQLEATGVNGQGQIGLRETTKLSSKLEVRFAKSSSAPTSDLAYSPVLENLSNGDQIYAKLFVKPGEVNYSINSRSLNFRVFFSLTANQFFNDTPGEIILSNEIDTIPSSAFFGATLSSNFSLPSGVTTIGYYAFGLSNLGDLVHFWDFNNRVTNLENHAFSFAADPSALLSRRTLPFNFQLPNSVTSLGTINQTESFVFSSVKLNSNFRIPLGVKVLLGRLFQNAQLPLGFTIPSTVEEISASAFMQSSLPSGATWYSANHERLDLTNSSLSPGAYVALE